MKAPFVCSACWRALPAPSRKATNPPWQSKATFISFARPKDGSQEGRESKPKPLQKNDFLSTADATNFGDRRIPLAHPRPLIIRDPQGELSTSSLKSLFANHLTSPDAQAPPSSMLAQTSSVQVFETIQFLNDLLSHGRPLSNAWKFFVARLGPDVWTGNDRRLPDGSPPLLVAKDLLGKILQYRYEHPYRPFDPTTTEIVTTFAALGILDNREWRRLVWTVLRQLRGEVKQKTSRGMVSKKVEYAVKDLLGAWHHVVQSFGPLTVRGGPAENSSIENWAVLRHVGQNEASRPASCQEALLDILPNYPRNEDRRHIAQLAAATFAILTDGPIPKSASVISAAPFTRALAKAVCHATPDEFTRIAKLSGAPGSSITFEDIVNKRSDEILQRAKNHAGERERLGDKRLGEQRLMRESVQHEVQEPAVYRPFGTLSDRTSIFSRLNEALHLRDSARADQIWATVKHVNDVGQTKDFVGKDGSIGGLTREVYNHFILVFMALRRTDLAIEVWNRMVESGLKPGQSAWNSMLEGCAKARDATALENVWAKMIATGIRPDMICWTTRIAGLIDCGRAQECLRALEQMGMIWLAATKEKSPKPGGDIGGIVKPSIQTINAAIAGLIRKRQSGLVNRVLAWGATFDIKPDIITFNTLLRSLVREGRSKEVGLLFEQMEKLGIQGDIATFTTILDETFRNAESLSPEQQHEIINDIFSQMEAAGLEANQHTYGKIIYSLLQSSTKDYTAVKAVMQHMSERGHQTSSYINTILLEHQLSRNPPDDDAAHALLERIRLSRAPVDHIFWDRAIEGFAAAGDVSKALEIWRHMDETGNRVSYSALLVLVDMLVQNGELESARMVVKQVVSTRGGPVEKEKKGVMQQHHFWDFVARNRLLGQ